MFTENSATTATISMANVMVEEIQNSSCQLHLNHREIIRTGTIWTRVDVLHNTNKTQPAYGQEVLKYQLISGHSQNDNDMTEAQREFYTVRNLSLFPMPPWASEDSNDRVQPGV